MGISISNAIYSAFMNGALQGGYVLYYQKQMRIFGETDAAFFLNHI